MTLERRTQALLDLVEGHRCSQCDAIVAEARARAAALLAQAHADARARMREAFAEERRRGSERVAAALARLQTRRRLHEQQRTAALLALGWQRLPDALRARWGDDKARRAWIDAIVAMAQRVLPHTPWQIAHGPDLSGIERDALRTQLALDTDMAPVFVEDTGITAGLRIGAGGNVVDGTLAGLVADRVEVGAQLLRHLETPACAA